MGLDKKNNRCKTRYVKIKLPLLIWGLGVARFFGFGQRGRISPLVKERENFEREVKDQFLKLKEKGLSIPIFTL